MQAGLAIDVNGEVFKVKDPRVDRLKSGALSAEAFVHTIGPGDPFMLVDGCVYALSEEEFYASRAVLPVNEMSEKAFRYVLELDDLSFMHRIDSDYVVKARGDLPNCPACRYKRYKSEIAKLVKKYNIDIPDTRPENELLLADKAVYPQVSSPVVPMVSLLLQHMFRADTPERRDCIDCVEKHISQAAVLAGECVTGYPEHVAFVVAHLSEALDEMPPNMGPLRDAVMFCLAKTKKDGKPFVPAYALLPLINLARYELAQSIEDQDDSIVDDRTGSMDIDMTDEMRDELSLLPNAVLLRLERLMTACVAETSSASPDRLAWEGRMAQAAECTGQMAPALANMLRNRRLLFIGDITAAAGEWSGEDVLACIEKCLDRTNKN